MINNFLLDVLAAGAILSGILVITSKNPVIAVLFLIAAFCNAAGYLILLGVGFVGISYILVYVGAITVLFLFVIMMINIKLTDILDVGSHYTKNFPLAFTVGSLFVYEIFTIIPASYNNVSILNLPIDLLNYINGIFFSSNVSSISEVNITQNPYTVDSTFTSFLQIEALGQGFYTYGAVIFIIISVILLLSMVAPILIVLPKQNNNQQVKVKPLPLTGSGSITRSSPVKILSQHSLLNKASYHTSSILNSSEYKNNKLNPWLVTGLIDGEGCFNVSIVKKI
jgi:NADH-ubiquinone oxidoreductase chain 6